MIGLRGARVLLIDDTLKEAIPVIKACAKKNIPIAYFDGTIDDLPSESEKFTQVRLVIADMDIIGGGDTDDNKVSTLIARLQRILAINNGPYTLISWTKHPDLIDLLDKKLFELYLREDEQNKVPLPILILRFEKKDFTNKDGEFDIEKLSSSIESELIKSLPLSIMQHWEELCLFSAAGVTNELAQLVDSDAKDPRTWRENWKNKFTTILNSLANQEIGEDNLKKETYYEALLGVLNPLQNDVSEATKIAFPSVTDEFINSPKVDINQMAGKINTKLHVSTQESKQFYPGNLYKLVESAKTISLDPNKLFENLVQKDYKNDKDLFNRTTPILLEVSASCDYAQNKIKFAKFLGGLLVEKNDYGLFKQPNYKQPLEAILFLDPLWLGEKEQRILLSSHYLLTLDKEKAIQLISFARLRNQWLTYVQFWLAQQLSRPGVVMLK